MNNIWILIIVMNAMGGGSFIKSIPFTDRTMCLTAQERVVKLAQKQGVGWTHIRATCVKE